MNRVINELGIQPFWDNNIKGDGVIVAVLGSGINVNHPEFKDRIIGVHKVDFSSTPNHSNVVDETGHETSVASIIAGNTIGVAPEAKLLIIKTTMDNGTNGAGLVARGLKYAIEWRGKNGEKVDIINMSFGSQANWVDIRDNVRKAVENNILVVCAAGNQGDGIAETDEWAYPAGYSESVSVGAHDQEFKVTNFSNSNAEVDLITFGTNINSASHTGGYRKFNGTSAAAPIVSGVAALLLQKFRRDMGRNPTESELYSQLIKNTTINGFKGTTDKRMIGNGRLFLRYEEVSKPLVNVDDVTFEQAIRGFNQLPINGIDGEVTIDSPDWWLDLSEKQKRGEPITAHEFRFYELAVRKMYTYVLNTRR